MDTSEKGSITTNSCPCSKSELDLFSVPPTQISISSTRDIVVNPKTISDIFSIKFEYVCDVGTFLDLSSSVITFTVKIEGAGGDNNDNKKVGPINLFGHSLFEQIDLEINDTFVSTSNKCYAYEAYLSTILNYGKDALNTHQAMAMFNKDISGHMDDRDPTDDNCQSGLKNRSKYLKEGQSVEIVMRPFLALFHQERLLPPETKISLTLIPSSSTFNLMSTEADNSAKYKAKIENIRLHVRQTTVLPSLALSLIESRKKKKLQYPIRRLQLVPKTISPTSQIFQEDIFTGQIPNRITIVFVSEKSRSGSFALNPFNLKHYDLTEIFLTVQGVNIPSQPYKCNFGPGLNYTQLYHTLFSAMGNQFNDQGIDLTLEDYKNGYCIINFDLTTDQNSDGEHLDLIRRGAVSLSARFSAPVGETVSVMCLAEFQNLIEIDNYNHVFKDYAA